MILNYGSDLEIFVVAIYKFSSAKKVNQLHRMFSEMAHPIPEIPIVSNSQIEQIPPPVLEKTRF